MSLTDLVTANRSYRRFDQSSPIPASVMKELVDLARICPSTANRQPLKYMIISDPARCQKVYPFLAWAGYLSDWDGPEEGERPTGYILILRDNDIHKDAGVDPGITAQTILLGAAERGFGGCMIASIKRERLKEAVGLPEKLDLLLVIAMGVPAEEIVLEETGESGSIRYYRDAEGRHHVPKRPLEEIVLD